MPLEVKSKIALFADDAYLCRPVSSMSDAAILQDDLNNLVKYEDKWSMKFHPDKCKLLRITNK